MNKEKFCCATCDKDLMFELPQNISRWNSPTDKRVFCSGACITASVAPADCVTYVVPLEENPSFSAKSDDLEKYSNSAAALADDIDRRILEAVDWEKRLDWDGQAQYADDAAKEFDL